MIGTTNWWRCYLWRANPPTWSECHFRPPQRLRRLAECSRKAQSAYGEEEVGVVIKAPRMGWSRYQYAGVGPRS
jgi:hypothetical protein